MKHISNYMEKYKSFEEPLWEVKKLENDYYPFGLYFKGKLVKGLPYKIELLKS